MTILSLRFNEKNIKDYALVRDQQLTIGRNPDNDIVIDNMAVSGYHAVIESIAANFVVKDLNSTNGIFVNNQQTEMHVLQHNDVVTIGKHELVFNRMVFDRDARVDQSQMDDEAFFDYKTRFLDTKGYKELIRKAGGEDTEIPESADTEQKEQEKRGFLARLLHKLVG